MCVCVREREGMPNKVGGGGKASSELYISGVEYKHEKDTGNIVTLCNTN